MSTPPRASGRLPNWPPGAALLAGLLAGAAIGAALGVALGALADWLRHRPPAEADDESGEVKAND